VGLLSRAFGIKASIEDPAAPLIPYSALFESLGLGRSDAGVMVNEKAAMRLTTAFACIKVISEDLSALPLIVYQKMPDGSMREATEHRLYPLLRNAPNDMMTSMVYRGAVIASACGWGNAYSLIERDKAARVTAFRPIPSDKTAPVFVDGKFGFSTTATKDGQPAWIDPWNVLHIPGLTMDGIVGMSPIATCKQAFGLAIAAEKFGAQFFGQGARATGVLTHPGSLDTEAYENIKKSVREWATGDAALRALVLEEGLKWEQLSVNPNDAQFLETRKFQKEEIAQLYRVPMHLLADLTRSTNSNIEHQSLDYVRYCLKPWAVRIEQEINRKLLYKTSFFVEHDMTDIMRGDFASQTTGYQTMRNIGVMSANDILRATRRNPIPAEEGGDIRTVQGAMIPLQFLVNYKGPNGTDGAQTPASAATADAEGGDPVVGSKHSGLILAFRRVFRDAVGRCANRKTPDEQFAAKALQPALASMAEAILAVEFGSGRLSEQDETAVSDLARTMAAECSTWNLQNAAETATRLTETAFAALEKGLIG